MLNRWVLAALVLVIFVIHAPAIAGAQTSSSGCLAFPTPTAQQWTSLFPTANSDQACEVACGKWQMTCINMARASFRCFQALFQSLAVLDVVDCNNLTGTEKTTCNEQAKANQNSAVESLQADLVNAVANCQNSLDPCIQNCD